MELGFSDVISKSAVHIPALRNIPAPSTNGFIIKIIIAEEKS